MSKNIEQFDDYDEDERHLCPNCGADIEEVGCYLASYTGYEVDGSRLRLAYNDGSDDEFFCCECHKPFDPGSIGLDVDI